LLLDASVLLEAGSPASAGFLAITALEETAKIHIGMYRKSAETLPRRKDVLFRHQEKHHIAAAPTLAMGSRLKRVIGEPRMHELIELARSGRFAAIRESALYLEKCDGKLRVPSVVVTRDLARDLVLLAIEAFDNAFVGYTNRSYELGEVTDQIFEKWAKA
jgi:AbiV family abortive infection protein